MAKKEELTITLRMRNAMATAIKRAESQIKNMGKTVATVGKKITVTFLAMAAAVIAFATKALKNWSEQETAYIDMANALRSHGEEVDNNLKKLHQLSGAIQDETASSDNNVLSRMAKLRLLGVETDALEAAAKATIALKSIGMEEAAAIKAVALARAGEFSMLSRYIPALKTASTESEKAAIVNEFLAKGYQQQKDRLNTVAGQWENITGRISDFWEEIGRAISRNELAINGLKRLSDAIKKSGQAISDWIDSGGVEELALSIQEFAERAKFGFVNIGNYAKLGFALIMDAGETAINYLRNGWEAYFTMLANMFVNNANIIKKMWEAIKKPTASNIKEIGQATKQYYKDMWDDAKNIGRAVIGEDARVNKRTLAAMRDMEAARKEHNENLNSIDQARMDRLIQQGEKQVETEKKTIEEINIAKENAAKRIAELQKKIDDRSKKNAQLEEKLIARENQLKEKSLQDEVTRLQKIKSEREELAKKTVKGYIQELKEQKKLETQMAKEEKRAAKLQGELRRGVKHSKRDREFMAAYEKLDKARRGLKDDDPVMQQLQKAQAQLEQMKADSETLEGILQEIIVGNEEQKKLNEELQTLLQMG